ncbi:MAG: NAD(P)H-hydrate dehydratase [Clostridia bacterium]|nr:NAD(P)H-hydrate dehydratase [Clostridia bacterium]
MRAATPKQMNQLDSITINELGIPGIVLMENAALRVIEVIEETLGELKGKKVIVFAGKGNNGGDAFAVARHLFNQGVQAEVFLACPKQQVEGDAKLNLDILSRMGVPFTEVENKAGLGAIQSRLAAADLIVDGLLGTGIRGEIQGLMKEIIDCINMSGKAVISIDIPSGVDGESGKICGSAIKALKTVTFALPKIGQLIHPGCEQTGELIIADIGIPSKVVETQDIKVNMIQGESVAQMIPDRSSNSNKGNFGRIFIVSGSVGMTGAGCLTAGAALRTGAGLVYLGVPSILSSVYDACLLEAVTIPLEDEGRGSLSKQCTQQVLQHVQRTTVSAVGPGLSVNEEIVEIIRAIIENSEKPLILDADALNAISKDVSVLSKRKAEMVITPHPGEMARLAGISIEEVQNNRIKTAVEFSVKWGITTVLKGARTIVAHPDGSVYINTTGNSGMATGGTGDVLTGMIAGLVGQGMEPCDAAVAGVYLHGMAGDRAAASKGEHGMIAGDLVNEIPFVIKELVKKLKNDHHF